MTQSTKSTLIWSAIAIGILVLLFGLASLGSRGTDGGVGSLLSEPVSAADHSKGPENAKLTLVEYSDFQCPGCASFYPLVKQLMSEFPNDLRVVYRHFPLEQAHANARLAAVASEAAKSQGKFWEMHDILFNTQSTWSPSTQADAEKLFLDYAGSLGLNKDQFATDIKSVEAKNKVDADIQSGNGSGVLSTPTFFLNGKMMQLPGNYTEFKEKLNQELTAAQ